ncbi:MAG: hypothetical protein AAF108_07025 [Planctomycetota bacterium]
MNRKMICSVAGLAMASTVVAEPDGPAADSYRSRIEAAGFTNGSVMREMRPIITSYVLGTGRRGESVRELMRAGKAIKVDTIPQMIARGLLPEDYPYEPTTTGWIPSQSAQAKNGLAANDAYSTTAESFWEDLENNGDAPGATFGTSNQNDLLPAESRICTAIFGPNQLSVAVIGVNTQSYAESIAFDPSNAGGAIDGVTSQVAYDGDSSRVGANGFEPCFDPLVLYEVFDTYEDGVDLDPQFPGFEEPTGFPVYDENGEDTGLVTIERNFSSDIDFDGISDVGPPEDFADQDGDGFSDDFVFSFGYTFAFPDVFPSGFVLYDGGPCPDFNGNGVTGDDGIRAPVLSVLPADTYFIDEIAGLPASTNLRDKGFVSNIDFAESEDFFGGPLPALPEDGNLTIRVQYLGSDPIIDPNDDFAAPGARYAVATPNAAAAALSTTNPENVAFVDFDGDGVQDFKLAGEISSNGIESNAVWIESQGDDALDTVGDGVDEEYRLQQNGFMADEAEAFWDNIFPNSCDVTLDAGFYIAAADGAVETRLCADANGDSVLGIDDFNAWLTGFINNDLAVADQNFDDQLAADDFGAWLANFFLVDDGPTCPLLQ